MGNDNTIAFSKSEGQEPAANPQRHRQHAALLVRRDAGAVPRSNSD
jgi:hypothetical protein